MSTKRAGTPPAQDTGLDELISKYAGLGLSLADASIVVAAELYDTDRILTDDVRHFRVLRRSDGRPFTLLPADC